MKKETIIKLSKSFEESSYQLDGVEYWLARDLQVLLDYDEWRNFSKVIDKAKTVCEKSGQDIDEKCETIKVDGNILHPQQNQI